MHLLSAWCLHRPEEGVDTLDLELHTVVSCQVSSGK